MRGEKVLFCWVVGLLVWACWDASCASLSPSGINYEGLYYYYFFFILSFLFFFFFFFFPL
jgi:hypothetical protein